VFMLLAQQGAEAQRAAAQQQAKHPDAAPAAGPGDADGGIAAVLAEQRAVLERLLAAQVPRSAALLTLIC